MHLLQIFRFTSSKPSKSARAPDGKFTRQLTTSFNQRFPKDFFDALNAEFHFTLDPCSTDDNAKCAKHFTKEQDGLLQDWTGECVFCNPPYGREMPRWIAKCAEHGMRGGIAVMLIPARTDTKAFHEYIYHKAEIRFICGRLKFGGAKNSAPFPSMVVVFGGDLNGKP